MSMHDARGKRRSLRVGDRVRVLELGDILATLDGQGARDAIPFMPEMAAHCGRSFAVVKSAHKTCDPTGSSHLRRIRSNPVHLETRCNGGAHGGCQAQCLFFWHPDWLERLDESFREAGRETGERASEELPDSLMRGVYAADSTAAEIRYRCHATELVRFSTPISTREPTQYFRDVWFGNVSLKEFVVFGLRAMLQSARRAMISPDFWRKLKAIVQRRPRTSPTDVQDRPVPTQRLDLRAGESVRVRAFDQILSTLDENGRNRGLSYDPDMARSAGKTFSVAQQVDRVIDEKTGKMLRIRKDCLILDGLACSGKLNVPRLFCSRGALLFWRECWLERVVPPEGSVIQGADLTSSDGASQNASS